MLCSPERGNQQFSGHPCFPCLKERRRDIEGHVFAQTKVTKGPQVAGRQKDPQLRRPRGVLYPGGCVCEGLRVTKPGRPFLREVLTQQRGTCCAGLRGSRGPSRRRVPSSCVYLVQCVTDRDRDRRHSRGTARRRVRVSAPCREGLSVRGKQPPAVRSAPSFLGSRSRAPERAPCHDGACTLGPPLFTPSHAASPCTASQQNTCHTLTRRI